jgi:hypothetical protein
MDECRRNGCGHPGEAHQHYRGGTDCGRCECPHYLGQRSGRRTLAAAGCSVFAAGLAGTALVRMWSGYHGAGLVWLGLGSIGLVVIGANVADPREGGHGGH